MKAEYINIPETGEKIEAYSFIEFFMGDSFSVHRIPNSDYWIMRDQSGEILSHEHFQALIGKLSNFYQVYTPAQLETLKSKIVQRKEEKRNLCTENQKEGTETFQRLAKKGHVYLLQAQNGLYKIGKSKNVNKRALHLQTKSPVDIAIRGHVEVKDYHDVEKKLHAKFADKRRIGEWFALTEDDVVFILNLTTEEAMSL